jgi:hypothetical protein
VPHAPPISFSFIWPPQWNLIDAAVKSKLKYRYWCLDDRKYWTGCDKACNNSDEFKAFQSLNWGNEENHEKPLYICVPAEFWTGHFPYTSQKHCRSCHISLKIWCLDSGLNWKLPMPWSFVPDYGLDDQGLTPWRDRNILFAALSRLAPKAAQLVVKLRHKLLVQEYSGWSVKLDRKYLHLMHQLQALTIHDIIVTSLRHVSV